MRRLAVALGGVVILIVANVGIYQKQQLVHSGRIVLLELAPVDPRSLMQGDYMALRFRVADEAFRSVNRDTLPNGRLVLTVDERNVGTFTRFDSGDPIGPGEVVIRYRVRDNTPKLATNGFFFEEGTADKYAAARFGEFRVSPQGDAILTRMRGEKLEVLGPVEQR
jgi:uncharacterized membrane-anchored protein